MSNLGRAPRLSGRTTRRRRRTGPRSRWLQPRSPLPESSGSKAARTRAIAALNAFHDAYQPHAEATRFVLESAYRIGKMLQSVNDPSFRSWFRTTIADWEFLQLHPHGQSGQPVTITWTDTPYSDYAAEADFTLLDAALRVSFDFATGHHHYAGTASAVVRAAQKDLAEARDTWAPRLERVAKRYGSPEWAAASMARLGSLYDSVWTGVHLALPGSINENLEDCEQNLISKYAMAVFLARKHDVVNAFVKSAAARLADFTDSMGDAKMKSYVEATPDPTNNTGLFRLAYTPGEFLQWRSGVLAAALPSGLPAPLPPPP